MIIAQIHGGLGNQMFQYAAGRSLAWHHGTELELDTRDCGPESRRRYALDYFVMPQKVASTYAMPLNLRPEAFRTVSRYVPWIAARLRKTYQEPQFHFDAKFFDAPANCYLRGYWQSEKYFAAYSQRIREHFTIERRHVQHLTDVAVQLANETSVSVHIRRGDYLEPGTTEVHGVLPISYYHTALDRMRVMCPNLKTYYFSDDPDWVRTHLAADGEVVSGRFTQSAIEDLYLMSQCRHNIIANSSFSWWAAWLNDDDAKIVFAPRKWFDHAPHDTKDLVPESWTRI